MKKKFTRYAGLSLCPRRRHYLAAIQRGAITGALVVLMTIDGLGQANPLRQIGIQKMPKTFQSTKEYAHDFVPGSEVFVEDPCIAPITPPVRDGLFQLYGDFELFGSSWASTCTVIQDECNVTHPVATLQENCAVTSWKVSHGTPEICVDAEGNHKIHLWSGDWGGDGDVEGEGVFFNCGLNRCNNYEFTMKLSSFGTIDKVYFFLVPNPVHRELDGTQYDLIENNPFYHIPNYSDLQLIDVIENFNSPTPVEHKLPVFSPFRNNAKLWIYPFDRDVLTSAGIDLLFIDDVTDGKPGSISTCEGNISYTTTVPSFTKANRITAQGSVTINSPSSVEFVAGREIFLKPNFHARQGSEFIARILPCVTSSVCPAVPVVRVNSETMLPLPSEMDVDQGVTIYPNPAARRITIRLDRDIGPVEAIEIVDPFQQTTRFPAQLDPNQEIHLDLQGFKIGVYHVRIITPNEVIVKRIAVDPNTDR